MKGEPVQTAERAPRMLRRWEARAMLYKDAGGRCRRCGGLLGEDWEADHIRPWRETGRTNVFELQALCRACNRAKG